MPHWQKWSFQPHRHIYEHKLWRNYILQERNCHYVSHYCAIVCIVYNVSIITPPPQKKEEKKEKRKKKRICLRSSSYTCMCLWISCSINQIFSISDGFDEILSWKLSLCWTEIGDGGGWGGGGGGEGGGEERLTFLSLCTAAYHDSAPQRSPPNPALWDFTGTARSSTLMPADVQHINLTAR